MDDKSARTVAETIGAEFKWVHRRLREEVGDLDAEAINWVPTHGANSIAALVTHTLGSEREMIRAVRAIKIERDRDSEFLAKAASAAELVAMLERADADISEHVAALTGEDLTAPRPRGERPPRPGIEWLVTNYGHAREHLAQVELTKQLHEARPAPK